MKRALLLTISFLCILVTTALAETLDFSESHPNVPPSVCPVCARNRALLRDKLKPGFRGEVIVNTEADYRSIRRMLVDIKANDSVVLLRQSSAPEVGVSRLDVQPKSVTIYHDMPTSVAEAKIIHGDKVRFDADSFRILKTRASRIGSVDLRDAGGGKTVAERLKAELARKADDDLAIVMGHVNKEGRIVFHDESSIPVSEIQSPGTTWVVGCKTSRFATDVPGLHVQFPSRVYYAEAISLSEQVAASLAKPGARLRDALFAFSESEAVITTSVAGGVLLTQTELEDE